MRACGMQVHLHCGCALVATGAKHPQIQPAGHGHSAARSPHMPIQHAANGHRPAPQQGAAHKCRASRRLQRLSGPESGHPPRPTAAASGRGFAYTHTRPWGPASPLQLQLACTPKPPTEPPTALQMPRISRCVPAGVGAGDIPMPVHLSVKAGNHYGGSLLQIATFVS